MVPGVVKMRYLWGILLLACGGTAMGKVQVPGPGPLRVREVVSWNDGEMKDRLGKSPDWIELENISEQAVALMDFGLSDDPDTPAKSKFLSGTLAPGASIVVFASGRPERSAGKEFHVDFKLSADGDLVIITGPEGIVNDSVDVLPTTLANVSQGRLAADPTQWLFFAESTPDRPNPASGFESIAEPIAFSHEAGYYPEPFALALTAGPGSEVRYTLDGDEPSALAALYEEPLDVHDRSGEPNGISMIEGTSTANQHTDGWFPPRGLVPKAFSVRARAFRAGSLPGPIITRTFFVGLDPATKWQLPVIALTSPPDGLFDYEDGIYMLGKIFDDHRAANPTERLTGHTSANYTQRGSAWGRSGYFEFFEADGSLGIRQNVTLDIQGQSSRSFRQKSLGLSPEGNLSPSSTFKYPFFKGLQRRGLGGERDEFAGLRLRNSGNDWNFTMMRDALAHRLVAPLGIDVMTSRAVAVFLNGEFWGLYNLREQGDIESIAEHYGVPKNDIVMAESDGVFKEGDPNAASSYRELRTLVDRNDLSDPMAFTEVSELMDIDNFLHYQLAEIYLGNADWPHNNVRYWRGTGLAEEMLGERPGFDGRWRWMLFDADLAYAHLWTGGVAEASLASALSPIGRLGTNSGWATALLRGLMENPGFRVDFINTMAGHLNSVFSDARAKAIVNDMKTVINPIMSDQIKRWRTSNNSINAWRTNVRIVEGFARQRPAVVRRQFTRELGIGNMADVSVMVTPSRAGMVTIHRLRLDSTTPGVEAPVYPWEGEFFEDVPITFTATARPGYVFDRWEGREGSLAAMESILTDDVEFHAVFRRMQSALPLGENLSYEFDSWDEASLNGAHPPYMRLEQSSSPVSMDQPEALMDSLWVGPYGLKNRSRFVGLDELGIGLRITGRAAEFEGSGFPGAVVLALDTRGLGRATISWTAETLSLGDRTSLMTLQIAIGEGGAYEELTDALGNAVRYTAISTEGVNTFPPVALPTNALDQPYVELRWRYHGISGEGGSGALIRLDDITLTGTPFINVGDITTVRRTSPNQLTLTFQGDPDAEHLLQWSSDLGSWQDGETFKTTSAGESLLELIIQERTARFVRVARP